MPLIIATDTKFMIILRDSHTKLIIFLARKLFTVVKWDPAFRSTIKESLEGLHVLDKFTALANFTVHWPEQNRASDVDDDLGEIMAPPLKRSRTV